MTIQADSRTYRILNKVKGSILDNLDFGPQLIRGDKIDVLHVAKKGQNVLTLGIVKTYLILPRLYMFKKCQLQFINGVLASTAR